MVDCIGDGRIEIDKDIIEREKELGKMKDEFISTVSHELKTPLTSMRLYLSLLLQGKQGALNKPQTDTIQIIKRMPSIW